MEEDGGGVDGGEADGDGERLTRGLARRPPATPASPGGPDELRRLVISGDPRDRLDAFQIYGHRVVAGVRRMVRVSPEGAVFFVCGLTRHVALVGRTTTEAAKARPLRDGGATVPANFSRTTAQPPPAVCSCFEVDRRVLS